MEKIDRKIKEIQSKKRTDRYIKKVVKDILVNRQRDMEIR